MSGIFGSLFGGGKRKASQPADASGRAAATSSRTGPGPSSWTGPPPRDPKEWRGPHNPTRSSRDENRRGRCGRVRDRPGAWWTSRATRHRPRPPRAPREPPRARAPREPPRPSDGRREHRRRRSRRPIPNHEDPVLEECPHGTVQGVPDTAPSWTRTATRRTTSSTPTRPRPRSPGSSTSPSRTASLTAATAVVPSEAAASTSTAVRSIRDSIGGCHPRFPDDAMRGMPRRRPGSTRRRAGVVEGRTGVGRWAREVR